MLSPGSDQVDPGRFNGGVPQQIGQFCDVLAGTVKNRRKQMPQVVGKYLGRLNSRASAQALQFRPDLPAIQLSPAFGTKDRTGSGFLLFGVSE